MSFQKPLFPAHLNLVMSNLLKGVKPIRLRPHNLFCFILNIQEEMLNIEENILNIHEKMLPNQSS